MAHCKQLKHSPKRVFPLKRHLIKISDIVSIVFNRQLHHFL